MQNGKVSLTVHQFDENQPLLLQQGLHTTETDRRNNSNLLKIQQKNVELLENLDHSKAQFEMEWYKYNN